MQSFQCFVFLIDHSLSLSLFFSSGVKHRFFSLNLSCFAVCLIFWSTNLYLYGYKQIVLIILPNYSDCILLDCFVLTTALCTSELLSQNCFSWKG